MASARAEAARGVWEAEDGGPRPGGLPAGSSPGREARVGEQSLGRVPCQGPACDNACNAAAARKKATAVLHAETGVSVGTVSAVRHLRGTGEGTALCTASSPRVEAPLPAPLGFHRHPCANDGQKPGLREHPVPMQLLLPGWGQTPGLAALRGGRPSAPALRDVSCH